MTRPWPIAQDLQVELLAPEEAPGLSRSWRDLAARAIEPNVFYGPDLGLAGMLHLPEGRGCSLLLAWRGQGETRRLVGLLPVSRARGRHVNPLRLRRASAHYGTLSTPLLDPDRPVEIWAAMLSGLRRAGVAALALPYLHQDGPAAMALTEAARADSLPLLTADEHRRAFLRSSLPGADYLRATLESRRRKEADRQRRRLADEGVLAFALARSEEDVAVALEAFLALEARGWKGRAGTDLTHAAGAAAFFRQAAASGARDGAFQVASLTLDGRVIAAGLVAIAGDRAFYMKTTYDEGLARFSPGLLLTLNLTQRLLDDPGIADADSIAVADHPMIDRIWTERFPVASVLVGTRRGGGLAFQAVLACERLREHAVARIKSARIRLRRSRPSSAKDHANKTEAAPPT